MLFAATEEQRLIEDSLERIMSDQWDRCQSGKITSTELVELPVWTSLKELGLISAWLPEDAGGAGSGVRALLALARVIGRHLLPAPYLSSAVLCSAILSRLPDAEIRGLLEKMAAGDAQLALAIYEAGQRYDFHEPKTVAQHNDGGITLSGCKTWVLEAAQADMLIVSAKGPYGTSLYLVPTDTSGVTLQEYAAVDGTPMASVVLDNVAISSEGQIADATQSDIVLDYGITMVAFAISSEVLGACEAVHEQTLDYMRIREQFGRPIAKFQALQFRMADLHVEIEMLRSLFLGAMNQLEEGKGSQAGADVAAAAAMAARVGDLVGREAIQMHGAIGMTESLGIGRYLMRINTICRLFGDQPHFQSRYLELTEEVLK